MSKFFYSPNIVFATKEREIVRTWGIEKYTQVLIGRSGGRYGRPGNRREHDVKIKTAFFTYHVVRVAQSV